VIAKSFGWSKHSPLHDDKPFPPTLTLTPIGILHTPFPDRVSTPRQPHAAGGAEGRIELFPGRGLEHAVMDLEEWEYIWVLFWFHLNSNWRPKVLPPRSSGKRRGVLGTRSPHRPNPIGLSLVRLVSVEGLTLHVRDVDMIDGSPVFDIKPYLPYAEARPNARTGWIENLAPTDQAVPADPEPGFTVSWSEEAAARIAFLRDELHVDIQEPIERTLRLGPQPHPYRRIRIEQDGTRQLAHKDWRAWFSVDGRHVTIITVDTGYRDKDLVTSQDPAVEVHRAFVDKFGRAKRAGGC
jgi:tRNA (adenine37-N6)-methyltransferase